jgi:hypothetical protein
MGELDRRVFRDPIQGSDIQGNPDHVRDSERKAQMVRSTKDLPDNLYNLDRTDPKTAYTIVITSYDTMRVRTTQVVSHWRAPMISFSLRL